MNTVREEEERGRAKMTQGRENKVIMMTLNNAFVYFPGYLVD